MKFDVEVLEALIYKDVPMMEEFGVKEKQRKIISVDLYDQVAEYMIVFSFKDKFYAFDYWETPYDNGLNEVDDCSEVEKVLIESWQYVRKDKAEKTPGL